MTKHFLLLLFLLLWRLPAFSQSTPEKDPFRDHDGNTWHQMNLDFKADEIIEIRYINSDDPVDGTLSPDGTSILIKNYPGDRAVKVLLKTSDGSSREISKGKCFIDPVLQYL
jgi:hypothetical protein